jgi:hypothetical protein
MPLGGCYIWKYMFPLFSDAEFINLTFGYRLEGYVDFAGASYSKILDSVLLITDNNSDFSRTEDINEFFLFVKDSRISRESRKAAMALIEKYYGLGQDQITRIVEVNKKIYLLA